MKENMPSRQQISPRKFDDKFVLDDLSRKLKDVVERQLRSHEALLNGPGPSLAQVELDNEYPEELVKIAIEVSQTSTQLIFLQSEYEKSVRDKLILEKKFDL
jgi:hypothetical protein